MTNTIIIGFAALFFTATIAAVASAGNPADPNTPGATGRTIVRGDNSTIAGDAQATRMQQTGGYSR